MLDLKLARGVRVVLASFRFKVREVAVLIRIYKEWFP